MCGEIVRPHVKLPIACIPIEITGLCLHVKIRWTTVNVTAPLVSLDKAKFAKWQARHCRMAGSSWRRRSPVYWIHLSSSFSWLIFTEAADAHHGFIYIGPSRRCPGVIISSTLLPWCYHCSSWFDMAVTGQWGPVRWKRLDSLYLSLETWRKREERVVMVSGWWDERQMVFAGRGRWPSNSGLSMSLSRHCSSLTCSTCHNGSLPFYMKTPTDIHAAMKWAID